MKYCWETSALSWSCPISPELKGDLWGCCGGSNSSNFLLQGLRFYWVLCKGKWKISMYVFNSPFLKCVTMELKLGIAFGVWIVKKSQIFHHVLAVKYLKVMKIVWIKILISNINECLYICLLKLKLDINFKRKKNNSKLSNLSLMVTRNVNSTLGTVCWWYTSHQWAAALGGICQLVTASSWAKPPLECVFCVNRTESTVLGCQAHGSCDKALFFKSDCKPSFSLWPQAERYQWGLSLWRAAGVVNGMCLMLWWEMHPESQAAGARHQSLMQSLGAGIITHIKDLFYGTDCVTNSAWHVWSRSLCSHCILAVLRAAWALSLSLHGAAAGSVSWQGRLPCLCHMFGFSAYVP